jgi:hypothetical protein
MTRTHTRSPREAAPGETGRVEPWRTGMPARPELPVPPAPMPLVRGGRPLKRWRYVGCFGQDVMLCAAVAHIGPVPVAWWALWDREQRTLAEHTRRRPKGIVVEPGRVRVDDGPVFMDLRVVEAPGVETVSPHGRQYIWTRKQGGVRITGTVSIAERAHAVDALGIVDESAGYHARRTAWHWSAGVGISESGAPVAWNLVAGLHDAPAASERTVWVDGEPRHTGPVVFDGLDGVTGDDLDLRFAAEATRERTERLLLVSSRYEQPFGTFTGELPGAGRLREGYGVMERHDVRW